MPRIFAIGDLHLSLSVENKSMDVFGPGWANHVDRLREGWQDTVGEDDLVLIPGDISWGLRLKGLKGAPVSRLFMWGMSAAMGCQAWPMVRLTGLLSQFSFMKA